MTDLAKIGLPLQIAGFVGMGVAWGFHAVNWMGIAMLAHLVGDALFYFQMKRQGCL